MWRPYVPNGTKEKDNRKQRDGIVNRPPPRDSKANVSGYVPRQISAGTDKRKDDQTQHY